VRLRSGPASPAWRSIETGPESRAEGLPQVNVGAVLRLLSGLTLVFWALRTSQGTFLVPGASEGSLALLVLGVIIMGVALLPVPPRLAMAADLVVLVGAFAAFMLLVRIQTVGNPAYGTDEIALDQAAAETLLGGVNPYATSLAWALAQFGVPAAFSTNTVIGVPVHALSYPALSFLVYVPAVMLGIRAQAAVYVDAMFWMAGILALWLVLPPRLRPLAPIVGALDSYVDFVIGGVSDALFLPFLVLALWKWDRFDNPQERSWARWMGPLALGLASGFKQSVWFLVPFLVIGVAMEARRRGVSWIRSTALYAMLALLAFLLPNLPFLVWDAGAWARGVTLPMRDPLVPFGQALVTLTLYLNLGGGHLLFYKIAGGLMLVAAALALLRWYPTLKRALPVLPLLALLFPTRSLANYFTFAVPAFVVAAVTGRPARRSAARGGGWPRVWTAAAAGVAAAGLAALGIALAVPGPLSVDVTGTHKTGLAFDTLTLRVENRTDQAISPRFVVTNGRYEGSFWMQSKGPRQLAGKQTATYVLRAPNLQSMPSLDQSFEVYAFTFQPQTLSASRPYQPTRLLARITPLDINRMVAPGEKTQIQVRVLDRFGQPVRSAGIPVVLSQAGISSINGAPQEARTVRALTDDGGVARFQLVAAQPLAYPVVYQAWVDNGYAQGYSNLLSVWYG
jgi:hypothetical protein